MASIITQTISAGASVSAAPAKPPSSRVEEANKTSRDGAPSDIQRANSKEAQRPREQTVEEKKAVTKDQVASTYSPKTIKKSPEPPPKEDSEAAEPDRQAPPPENKGSSINAIA